MNYGRNDELDIVASVSLDKSNRAIDRLNRDLEDIENKLKNKDFSISLDVDTKDTDKFKEHIKQVTELAESMSKSVNLDGVNAEFSKAGINADKLASSMKNVQEQNNLISRTVMSDLFSGLDFKQIENYQNGLNETIKVVKRLNEDGEVIGGVEEKSIDYLKVQKDLYKDLLGVTKDINNLENLRLNNKNIDLNQVNEQIRALQSIKSEIEENISNIGVENKELDRQIGFYEEIERLKRSSKEIDKEDKSSNQAYKELLGIMKEHHNISKNLIQSEGLKKDMLVAQKTAMEELINQKKNEIIFDGLQREEGEELLRLEKEKMDRVIKRLREEDILLETINQKRALAYISDEDTFNKNDELKKYIESRLGEEAIVKKINEHINEQGVLEKQIEVTIDKANGKIEKRKLIIDEINKEVRELSKAEEIIGDESLSKTEKQKQLYSELKKIQKEYTQTESAKVGATDGGLDALNKHTNSLKARALEIQNILNKEGLVSEELQKQIQLETDLAKAKLKDKKEKGIEKDSLDKYRELVAVMKESYNYRIKALQTTGKISEEHNKNAEYFMKTMAEIYSEINNLEIDSPEGQKLMNDELAKQSMRLKNAELQKEENERLEKAKKLYSELLNLEREKIGIESSIVGASEIGKKALTEQLESVNERIESTRQELESQKLINQEKEESIRLEKELRNAKLEDKKGKSDERATKDEYREIIALTKEYYSLLNKNVKASGEESQIYQMRANDISKEIKALEEKIRLDGRAIEQEEEKLSMLKDSLSERLAVVELIRDSTDTEKLKIDLYGEVTRLQKQEFKDMESLIGLSGESKKLVEDRLKATKESIESIKNEISSNKLVSQEKEKQLKLERESLETNLQLKHLQHDNSAVKKIISDHQKLANEVHKYNMLILDSEGYLKEQYKEQAKLLEQRRLDKFDELKAIQTATDLSDKEIEVLQEQLRLQISINAEKERLAQIKKQEKEDAYQRSVISDEITLTPEQFDDDEMVKQAVLYAIKGADEITKFTKVLKEGHGEVAKMVVRTQQAKGKVKEYTVELDRNAGVLRKVGEATKEVSYKSLNFIEMIKFAIQRTIQWDFSKKLVSFIQNLTKEGISFIKELDSELTQVSIVTGKLRAETNALANEYVGLGIAYSKTVDEIARMNTELVRQGLTSEEAMNRMQSVLKLSAVGNIGSDKTLSIITSGVNALGEDVDRLSDILVKAGNISASSAESVGDALTKTASSAKSAKFETTDLVATISGLIEVTQESPSSLGNSLKTLTARYNRVNEETGQLNTELNDVQKAFESVGITFTDQFGQIRPVFDLWKDLNLIWDDLDNNTKSYIANMSAGVMQQNRFMAIMDNFNRIQEINLGLQNASGETTRNYSRYLDSVEASSKRAQASLQGLWIDLISSDGLKFMYDLLFSFTELARSVANNKVLLNGLFLLLTTQLALSTKNMKLLRREMTLTYAQTKSLKAMFGTMFTEMGSLTTGLIAKISSLGAGMKSIAGGFASGGISGALSTTAGASLALGVGLAGLIGVLAIVIKKTVEWISKKIKANEELKKLGDTVKSNIQGYKENIEMLENTSDSIDKLIEKVGKERDLTKLTTEEKEEYLRVSEQIKNIAPELIAGYDERGNALIRYGTTIDDVIDKQKELIRLENIKLVVDGGKQIQAESKKIKDANKEIEKLSFERQTIIKSMEYNSEQIIKAKDNEMGDWVVNNFRKRYEEEEKALMELELKLDEILARKEISVSQMVQLGNAHLEVMKEIDNFEPRMKTDLIEGINQLISETGGENIAEVIKSIDNELANLRNNINKEDIKDGTILIDDLAQNFVDLGFDVEWATQLIVNYAFAQEQVSDTGEGAIVTVSQLTDAFKGLSEVLNFLESAYKKLSKGDLLGDGELIKLMEEFPEIAEYLAETGDLSLENGEKILELMEKISREKKLQAQNDIKNLENRIKLEEEELNQMQNTLDILTKQGKVETEVYKATENAIKDKTNSIKEQKNELLQATNYAKIYNNHLMATSSKDRKEASYSNYSDATRQLKLYTDAQEELNKEKGITFELMDKLLAQDQDLISFMGSEMELRDELTRRIQIQRDEQLKYYRDMMANSEAFSRSVLKNNQELFREIAKTYDLDLKNFENLTKWKMQMASRMGEHSLTVSKAMASQDTAQLKRMSSALGELASGADLGATGGRAFAELVGGKLAGADKETQLREKQRIDQMIALQEATESSLDKIKIPKASVKGISSSSKKASKSMQQMIDKVEMATDRYKKFDIALREVERSLEMNNALMNVAEGQDRIALLRQEHYYLKEKQQLLALNNIELNKEEQEIRKRIKSRINLEDGTLGSDSFNKYTKNVENQINSIIDQLNKTSNDATRKALEDRRKVIEKEYEKTKKDFDRLLEVIPKKSDNSIEWWILEFEKLEKVLGQIETRFENFNDKISKIDNLIKLNLSAKSGLPETMAMEQEALQNINELYIEMLGQIEKEYDLNVQKMNEYENKMNTIGKDNQEEYDRYRKRYIESSAIVNKYFEMYETNLHALKGSMDTTITNISNQAKYELEEIKNKIKDIRNEVKEFDLFSFNMSLQEILYSLDKIDGIFSSDTEFNLDTSKARDDINYWKDEILDFVGLLENMDSKSKDLAVQDGDSLDILENKKNDMVSLLKEEVKFEQDLIKLQNKLNKELKETEFKHKQIEESIQNQISMKEKELQALQDQYDEEDRLQAKMEKQLELLGAMDDTRYSYITGVGEEIFTYDQSKVLALQKELAELEKQEERDEEIDKRQKEIEKMREDLAKTKEINAEELQVLRLAISGINEIRDLTKQSIDRSQETLDKIYEKTTEEKVNDFQNQLNSFTSTYMGYWDRKIANSKIQVTFDPRQMDWSNLGGNRPDTDEYNDPDRGGGYVNPHVPPYDPSLGGGANIGGAGTGSANPFPFDELADSMSGARMWDNNLLARNIATNPNSSNRLDNLDNLIGENQSDQPNINIQNANFNGVQNVRDFGNEMRDFARNGIRGLT